MKLSVLIPVYNEVQSIGPLLAEVAQALEADLKKGQAEILVVDDGSTDGTYQILIDLQAKYAGLKLICLRANFGQSAALDAGFKEAAGEYLVSLDGDGQNDPADIPLLLAQLDQGYDVVCGWRRKRKDTWNKKIFSRLANRTYRLLTSITIHDSGCSLRAYRRDCFIGLDLTGEMHRHIPALLTWRGFKIGETEVNHRPRRLGKSKYGLARLGKGFLDLLVVVFWQRYSARPIHIFGGLGLLLGFLGAVLGLWLSYMRLFRGYSLSQKITPLIAVFLVVLGVQFFIFGILADIVAKIYFSGPRKTYSLKEIRPAKK